MPNTRQVKWVYKATTQLNLSFGSCYDGNNYNQELGYINISVPLNQGFKTKEIEMGEYGEIAKEIIIRYLGSDRVEKICREYHLNATDQEVLYELIGQWKPDYTLEDIRALCQGYQDQPNIQQIMQAFEAIAIETAQKSQFQTLDSNN